MVLLYSSNGKIFTNSRSVMKKKAPTAELKEARELLYSTPGAVAFRSGTVAPSPFMNKILQPPTALVSSHAFTSSIGASLLTNFSFRDKNSEKNIKYKI